jgi:GntR family transcriptional regulator of arabinose operon
MTGRRLPKYLQLKQEILSWLQSGQLEPHSQLPSEHEIAGQFGMSRQTVRQTLGEMEKEGWLYRLQGKGTFVSQPVDPSTQEMLTIGMLTTHISDYIFPHIVRGAEAQLRSKGYSLLLSSTENDKEKERENLQMMLGQSISGLIVEPTKSALGNPNLSYYLSLQVRGIPFIMINARYPELNCPCVSVDDEAGGLMATEHLIQLGHTKIAGFFKIDDMQGVSRLKGFMQAHQQANLPLMPDSVVLYNTEEKLTKPFNSALELLQQEDRPTAIVCYNDELAVLLLDAIRQIGLSVPDELSLVGFDDSFLATATEVKLTTLTHPKMDMGISAAELLFKMITNKASVQAQDILFTPELVIRNSTQKNHR